MWAAVRIEQLLAAAAEPFMGELLQRTLCYSGGGGSSSSSGGCDSSNSAEGNDSTQCGCTVIAMLSAQPFETEWSQSDMLT